VDVLGDILSSLDLTGGVVVDVRPMLSRVRHPVLVLHARGHQAIPFAEGEALAREIEGARFVPLESDNHILLEKEPAFRTFVGELKDFLNDEQAFQPATPVSA